MASNLCASTRPMARAPVGNTQRRTRHRRVTTVSSTSSFRRRRRRRRGRLLGRQAAGARPRHHIRCWLRRAMRCDGAFAAAPAQHARTQRHRSVLLLRARCIRPGALCVHGRARHGVRAHLLRSASASRREAKGARPSTHDGKWREICCEQICPPRAQHASVGRCTGSSWPDLGVRAQLLRSARASQGARRIGPRRSMANGEIVVSSSVLRRAWCRPQRGGGARIQKR